MKDEDIIKTVDGWKKQETEREEKKRERMMNRVIHLVSLVVEYWHRFAAFLLPGFVIFALAIQLYNKVWNSQGGGGEVWGAVFFHIIVFVWVAASFFAGVVAAPTDYYRVNGREVTVTMKISLASTIFFWAIFTTLFTLMPL